MKVQLRVTVSDVGKDGEVVDVDEGQGTWLVNGGYAVAVDDGGEQQVAQEDSA